MSCNRWPHISAPATYNIENGSKASEKYKSIITIWYMKSKMLRERNNQFALAHIRLFICLKALDSMKK